VNQDRGVHLSRTPNATRARLGPRYLSPALVLALASLPSRPAAAAYAPASPTRSTSKPPAAVGSTSDPLQPTTPASPPVTEPASEPPTPAIEPPLPDLACDPQCPAGAVCHEGQCLITCDPSCTPGEVCAAGECRLVTEPEPEPEPEPIPNASPPAPESEPPPRTLSLRLAPGVAACMGEGCRRIQVGDTGGSMGVGGSFDVRLAYRVAPQLAFELGGLAALHGNDIAFEPATAWFLANVGPRLYLSGGRWRAEPVLGVQLGYIRSLVRWSDAGSSSDGLAFGVDGGVDVRITPRINVSFLTGLTLPYWTRVCEADAGIRDCHPRSLLTSDDLRRYFWVTSVALGIRLF
jgi:hypothetical protein